MDKWTSLQFNKECLHNEDKVQQGSCLPVRYEVAAHHQGQVPSQGRHGGPGRAGEQGGED